MIDEKYVKEYIGSILTVKDKWYYNIPLIGQRLYQKAKSRHSFKNNKNEIFDFITDIITNEIAYDDNCYKAILEEFSKNKRSYSKSNWDEIIRNMRDLTSEEEDTCYTSESQCNHDYQCENGNFKLSD